MNTDAAYRVVARYGAEVELRQPDGTTRRAALRRSLPDIVCGDRVTLDPVTGAISTRLARHNQLTRRDGFKRVRTMAANIDRVWIVVAAQPATARFLIDRFLIGIYNLPAAGGILWNKDDLFPLQHHPDGQSLLAGYGHLGLPILAVSAMHALGLVSLQELARAGSNILVGPSGVGKSALIQALFPTNALRTAPLGHSGEGQHTTTQARWYESAQAGIWIDSPGVRDYTPQDLDTAALTRGFPDFAAFAMQCQFRDCSHQHESRCGVRAAVEHGEIPDSRYAAWLTLSNQTKAMQQRDST